MSEVSRQSDLARLVMASIEAHKARILRPTIASSPVFEQVGGAFKPVLVLFQLLLILALLFGDHWLTEQSVDDSVDPDDLLVCAIRSQIQCLLSYGRVCDEIQRCRFAEYLRDAGMIIGCE